jgi:DnaJ-class molecular chaperone
MTPRKGQDAVLPLQLTLAQAALGTVVRPAVPLEAPCVQCQPAVPLPSSAAPPPRPPCEACGSTGVVRAQRAVEVQVPGGVESGARLRLRGQGGPGLHGGPRGDLYLVCEVREHALLVRRGAELFCEVVVSEERARGGTHVDVPALDGPVRVEVPAGTRHGALLAVPGRGGRSLRAPGRGALVVRVIVGGLERPARGNALLARLREAEVQAALRAAPPPAEAHAPHAHLEAATLPPTPSPLPLFGAVLGPLEPAPAPASARPWRGRWVLAAGALLGLGGTLLLGALL